MKHLLLLLLLSGPAWSCFSSSSPTADQENRSSYSSSDSSKFILLELFTSQGCSSCPPADQVLTKLTEEAELGELPIVALSYHVDYWNRLGWTDPYSQQAFSERQRVYARKLPNQRVYTPQLVINGQSGHVGSREREIRAAIQTTSLATATSITLDLTNRSDQELQVEYTLQGRTDKLDIFYTLVDAQLDNEVPRGENRGQHLQHVQVVREFGRLPANDNAGSFSANLNSLDHPERAQLIVYAQDANTWAVTGIALLKL